MTGFGLHCVGNCISKRCYVCQGYACVYPESVRPVLPCMGSVTGCDCPRETETNDSGSPPWLGRGVILTFGTFVPNESCRTCGSICVEMEAASSNPFTTRSAGLFADSGVAALLAGQNELEYLQLKRLPKMTSAGLKCIKSPLLVKLDLSKNPGVDSQGKDFVQQNCIISMNWAV